MYSWALRQQKGDLSPSAEHCLRQIEYQKTYVLTTKTQLLVSGLEHPPAGAYVTVCRTEPWGLYISMQNNGLYITNIQIIPTDTYRYIQIHTDTCNTYTYIYIYIHTHTHTYIHPAISVRRGF